MKGYNSRLFLAVSEKFCKKIVSFDIINSLGYNSNIGVLRIADVKS